MEKGENEHLKETQTDKEWHGSNDGGETEGMKDKRCYVDRVERLRILYGAKDEKKV